MMNNKKPPSKRRRHDINVGTPNGEDVNDNGLKKNYLIQQLMSGGAGGRLNMERPSGKQLAWNIDQNYDVMIDDESNIDQNNNEIDCEQTNEDQKRNVIISFAILKKNLENISVA